MKSFLKQTALALTAVLGVGVVQAQANQIDLVSTGVAADGTTLLPGGSVDPHYTLTLPGATTPQNALVVNDAYPIMPYGPFWAPNGPDSEVAFVERGFEQVRPGVTTYTTTFDLTGLDPSTAKITGTWGVDNTGQIFLNGQHVAGQDIVESQTALGTPLFPFTINSGFQPGVNTLSFQVWNDGGPNGSTDPAGFRLNVTSATADPMSPTQAPEPSTLALGGMAVIGLLVHQRRRRSLPA